WLWVLAAARVPTVTLAVTAVAIAVGLGWAAVAFPALRFGIGWFVAFFGSLCLPSPGLRRVGSAVTGFGGSILGIALGAWTGSWCTGVGAALVGAVGLWVAWPRQSDRGRSNRSRSDSTPSDASSIGIGSGS
ncbi:MAG: hypothetical protein ABMB14_20190, partial [Myxococcota bacterium]